MIEETPVHAQVRHPPDPRPRPDLLENLHRAAGNWATGRAQARDRVDWEAWRERARAVRADAVAHLPELLDRLEERVTAAGGAVHHAATAADAAETVVRLCRERGATLAVKSKSMLSEEIGLGPALADAGVEPVETDLGEWIVQLRGEPPSHILAPAVHLSAPQIAAELERVAGRAFDPDDTALIVGHARETLRERFLRADVGISGVNLAVAETGTLVLVESEGNIRLCTSLPRTHIAVMGVEKVVRDWAGAAHIIQMLPLAAHGHPAAAYTSCLTGPARDGDDGPEELHLVLVDAGRLALRGTEAESLLHCIRCGACLYACPVYRQIGGHAYGSTYSGPIGAALTPMLERFGRGTAELPWLSSLCGACTEACPVKIPLDDLLARERAWGRAVAPRRGEGALFAAWSRLWSRPAAYRATAATAGRALAPLWRRVSGSAAAGDRWFARAPFPFSGWTDTRDARAPDPEPFHLRWKRRRGP